MPQWSSVITACDHIFLEVPYTIRNLIYRLYLHNIFINKNNHISTIIFTLSSLSFPVACQVLKLYAWEESFCDRVLGIRNSELACLRTANFLTAGSSLSWYMTPYLVSRLLVILFSNHSKLSFPPKHFSLEKILSCMLILLCVQF